MYYALFGVLKFLKMYHTLEGSPRYRLPTLSHSYFYGILVVSLFSFPAKNIIMLIYFVSISRDFEFCQIVSLPRNFNSFSLLCIYGFSYYVDVLLLRCTDVFVYGCSIPMHMVQR